MFAALALATLIVVPLTGATTPGRNGRLLFMREDAGGHWQVWVSDARLDSPKKLTSERSDSGYAVWSPNGRRIAFESARADRNPKDSKPINDIFTMNPDGSGVTKLTDSTRLRGDPAWSPNGSVIAFGSDRVRSRERLEIYVMRSDGSKARRITTLPANAATDIAPDFSPNGKLLVFTRYRGEGRSEKAALFTVRLDGSKLRRLTSFAIHAGDAHWSPNGKLLVFEADPRSDSSGDIYVIQSNGRGLRNLTRNPPGKAGSGDPVWSPDGTKILFLDSRLVGARPMFGLATMRPDGSARHFVTSQSVESHQPDWESVH